MGAYGKREEGKEGYIFQENEFSHDFAFSVDMMQSTYKSYLSDEHTSITTTHMHIRGREALEEKAKELNRILQEFTVYP